MKLQDSKNEFLIVTNANQSLISVNYLNWTIVKLNW